MNIPRALQWIAGIVLAPVVLAILYVSIFGWNSLRGPIERMALERTGRQLLIAGDLEVSFAWPLPRIHTGALSFANPLWAKEKQMISADALELVLDLPQLLQGKMLIPELRLVRPVIHLEQSASGQKNWLLDLNQQNEAARIRIGRLSLDRGTLGYDASGEQTSIRAQLSSAGSAAGPEELRFTLQGKYKGLPLRAEGTSGPVLALRDERTPYPVSVDLTVGPTAIKASGSVTSLLKFSALDMQLSIRGKSLAQLFPLLGIALPETRPYASAGRLVHGGQTWRYEKFSGSIGGSDIAGNAQIEMGGKRPRLQADLLSTQLELVDLGPLIGVWPGRLAAARKAAPPPSQSDVPTPTPARVLPDMPFRSERWGSVDAEVTLKAKRIHGAGKVPLESLVTHLSLQDSLLRLDPLDFTLAGGRIDAVISLDGRHDPMQAEAKVTARKIPVAGLFPNVDLNKSSVGQINGDFALSGNGNSVRRMLATASGKLGLVINGGQISKLMMEKAGLHLWEIVGLKMSGDRLVKLRCGVADFAVRDGVMQGEALIFDTEITTLIGTGSIDLEQEKLDLTFNQKTKNTSPLALRSPIHLRGTFARPQVGVDKGRVAVRALGAIALGIVNPLLALIPLIDAGPGSDSDCRQLIREAKAVPRPARRHARPQK